MHFSRPKSVLSLVVIGFSLVALPLIAAVVRALFYVDGLADQSELLVLRGVLVTRESEVLDEQITAMERNGRQHQVLGERALLELYEEKHQRFISTLDNMEKLSLTGTTTPRLQQMRTVSEAVIDTLREQQRRAGAEAVAAEPDEVRFVLAQFSALSEIASAVARQNAGFIDAELKSLRDTANAARQRLVWQSAALIPVALVLISVFTVLIARPIRQLGHSIRRLGEGDFKRSIEIAGPPELADLGGELEWLRRRLLKLEQEKNEFLRHMSHELKTPLASLREGTEQLVDGTLGKLSGTQEEVAAILRHNSRELQQLIENLLNFSAWQETKARLDLSRFELRPMLEAVLDNYRLSIMGKHLALELECDAVNLNADREKIRAAVDNLVSNAVKFSPRGGLLHIGAAATNGQVTIDVADAGPGIPESERESIFEPFVQGSAPQGGPVRGTGIGLWVVRESVFAHGGKIDIIDGEYEGAHFRILLPQAAVLQAA